MTRDLADIIPNPSTRAFLGRVYREWGVEWAATLTGALARGELIDCGEASPGDGPTPLPTPSRPADRPDTVWSQEQRRDHLRLF